MLEKLFTPVCLFALASTVCHAQITSEQLDQWHSQILTVAQLVEKETSLKLPEITQCGYNFQYSTLTITLKSGTTYLLGTKENQLTVTTYTDDPTDESGIKENVITTFKPSETLQKALHSIRKIPLEPHQAGETKTKQTLLNIIYISNKKAEILIGIGNETSFHLSGMGKICKFVKEKGKWILKTTGTVDF